MLWQPGVPPAAQHKLEKQLALIEFTTADIASVVFHSFCVRRIRSSAGLERRAYLLVVALTPSVSAANLPKRHPGISVFVPPLRQCLNNSFATRVELIFTNMARDHEQHPSCLIVNKVACPPGGLPHRPPESDNLPYRRTLARGGELFHDPHTDGHPHLVITILGQSVLLVREDLPLLPQYGSCFLRLRHKQRCWM